MSGTQADTTGAGGAAPGAGGAAEQGGGTLLGGGGGAGAGGQGQGAAQGGGQAAGAGEGAAQGAGQQQAAAPAWPDDWRQKLAGDDAATLKRMERFSSPADVWKSYRAMEQKLSSGEFKKAEPGENASPEEIAAWRKENGIPEAPEGYLEKLPDGVTINKEDGPLLKAFLAEMHKIGAPPKYAHAALKSYFDVQKVVDQELAEGDLAGQRNAEDALRSEWGNEYRANLNAIGGVLGAHLGNDLLGNLIDARMADGTKVGNHPEIIRGLLAIAKEVNPAATIVPAAAGNAGQGIEQRLGELQKMMGDPKSDYWKRGGVGEKLQAEYRQLVEAQGKLQQRAA